ncbi:MAG: hypothetical protein ACYTCU_02850 [Planctomycetota bacterium]
MKAGTLVLALGIVGLAVWIAVGRGGDGDGDGATPGAGPGAGPDAVTSIGADAERLQAAGDHDASAARFEEAAALALAVGEIDLARGYRAQAGVCFKLAGRVPRAHEIMLEVLAEARASGDRKHEGLALGNLARLEALGGNVPGGLAYQDELVGFARDEGDALLEVLTLEQAATTAFSLSDLDGALERLEAGLAADVALPAEDSRRDALLAQVASVRAARADDEGAGALWRSLTPTPASLANQARHLSELGLHIESADVAWAAVEGFTVEGAERVSERDRALALHISELLRAGELETADLQLKRVLAKDEAPEAMAAFRVLEARLALARRRAPDAIEPLQVALRSLADARETELVSLLLVVALHQSERDAEAIEVLTGLPASAARAMLATWVRIASPPEEQLIGEAVPTFRSGAHQPADDSLDRLAGLVPTSLPSRALIALEAGIADAARLRDAGAQAMADLMRDDAAREALAWQAIDARRAVFGLPVTPEGIAARAEAIDAWVAGRMPAGRALITVIPGETGSYLLLCTEALGSTSFPLSPAAVLRQRASEVVTALRGNDPGAVASASHDLYTTLLPEDARVDLDPATHWTFILPDALVAVPPAVLVSDAPGPGAPAAWLVRDRVVSVLPHVLGARPARALRGKGWLTVHAPAVDAAGLSLAAAQWTSRYGTSVWSSTPVRGTDPSRELTGGRATAPMLAAAVPDADGLRASGPGAGAGRLGGLMLAPAPAADSAGEAAGLLPWHRLAALDLPPDVILDGTRFELADAFGPAHAATAVLAHARRLLLTRWPLPAPLRDAMVERVQLLLAQGLPLDEALATVQRDYVLSAEAAGETAATHPRFWGALLPYGTD